MPSAPETQSLIITIRGQSGGLGVIALVTLLAGCAYAIWMLGSGFPVPTTELIIFASIASLFGLLAHDQRQNMLYLTPQVLEIWHGDRMRRLVLQDISALSLRATSGRYIEYQLIFWRQDGTEGDCVSLQPFRHTVLRAFMRQLHQAHPDIQLDHELSHYLQFDRNLP